MNAASSISIEHEQFLNIRKFESLDGLRCFSILAVIWHHATGVGKGYLGVELFFGISGFLITTLILRERRRFGDISLSKFYARRSLRIFPVYYAVLLLYICLSYFVRHQPTGIAFFHNLPFFATYTSNWFVPLDRNTIFYFSWSLATEEQFYMVVPSLERYLRGFAVLAIFLALVLHLVSGQYPLGIVIAKISTPLCLGVLAAHGLDDSKSFKYLAAVTYPKFASLFWLVATIVLGWVNVYEIFFPLAVIGLIVSSVIRQDHILAWFFDWSPFQAVGRVSYGMYMMHMLCLHLIKKFLPLPPLALFASGSVVAYLAALASFHWYESIFLRMKERYSHSG